MKRLIVGLSLFANMLFLSAYGTRRVEVTFETVRLLDDQNREIKFNESDTIDIKKKIKKIHIWFPCGITRKISATKKQEMRYYLNAFVEGRYPDAKVILFFD